MHDPDALGDAGALLQRLQRELTIIVGFSDILLERIGPDDPRRLDVTQIHASALSALDDLGELARRLR